VVSTNAVARRTLASMARSAGWLVDEFETLAAACDQAQASPPPWTIALVDLFGAEAVEWAACTRLREWAPATMLLGLVNPGQQAILRGVFASHPAILDEFLVKPVTLSMVVRARESWLRPVPEEPRTGLPAPRLEGVRILLVEDNLFNQQVARELLEAEGALVSVAGDGAEGVQNLREAKVPFDAVLMDMRMPGMDGLDATRLIRTSLKLTTLPIIAMTANALASDRAACLEAGMDDHLAKPFDRDKLVQTLRQYLKAPGTDPIFDGRLALQRFGNNKNTLEKVLGYWRTSTQTLPQELTNAAAEGHTSLLRFFHSLKASAATVGGTALAQFARQTEAQLADPATFRLEVVGAELATRLAALRDEIDRYLHTPKQG